MLTQSCYSAGDSITFREESDITIQRSQYLPAGYFWDFDTSGIMSAGNALYFYNLILHELGHALGLYHINDDSSLMYYTWIYHYRPDIPSYSAYPGPATLLDGLDIIYTSVASENYPSAIGCAGFSHLDTIPRHCFDRSLSVPVISEKNDNFNLFPNPINRGDITIAYQIRTNTALQFTIYDCTGRAIMKFDNENKLPGNYSEQINIDALDEGVYLFTSEMDGEKQTIKFIKL